MEKSLIGEHTIRRLSPETPLNQKSGILHLGKTNISSTFSTMAPV